MKKKCAILIAMCLVVLSMVACGNKANENVDVLGMASEVKTPVKTAVKVAEAAVIKETKEEASFLNFVKTPSGMMLLPTTLANNTDKQVETDEYMPGHEHDSDCYKVYQHSGKPMMHGTTYCNECKGTVPIFEVRCVNCNARYTYSCWHLGATWWSSGACKVELVCDKPEQFLICAVPESYLNCGQDEPATLVCGQLEHMHNPCTALRPVYHDLFSTGEVSASCFCGKTTIVNYACEKCNFVGFESKCGHQSNTGGLCNKEVYISCGLEEHKHSSDCYVPHNHIDNCYKTHKHDKACYVTLYN